MVVLAFQRANVAIQIYSELVEDPLLEGRQFMFNHLTQVLVAARFAANKHRHQRRKDPGASPYINHAIDVATILADQGGVTDVTLLVAALLHDTVEDTETSIEELNDHFGDQVGALVAEVTDDKSLPKQRRKQLQVETTPQKSVGAKQLKIADKISNVRDLSEDSPADWDLARKIEYLNWAQAVVAGCRGVNPQLEILFEQVAAEALQRLAPEV